MFSQKPRVPQRSQHMMLLWPHPILKHWRNDNKVHSNSVSVLTEGVCFRLTPDRNVYARGGCDHVGFLPTFEDRTVNQFKLLFHYIGGFTYHTSSRWSSLYDTGFPWPGRLGWLRTRPSHIWRRYLFETCGQLVDVMSTIALWLMLQ